MKLGEWLKDYRTKNNMTLQDLSRVCGFSKSYIGALEQGINPTTGKPFSPTIKTFEKIAKGTGHDLDSLLKLLDGDQSVKLNPRQITLSEEETWLIDGYRDLNEGGKQLIQGMIFQLRGASSKRKRTLARKQNLVPIKQLSAPNAVAV